MHGWFMWGCGWVTGATTMYTVLAVVAFHRRRRAMTAVREFMEGMKWDPGKAWFTFGQPVEPEDICRGDRIHYSSPDGACVTYTAGFHGDAGQQVEGQWLRLEQ